MLCMIRPLIGSHFEIQRHFKFPLIIMIFVVTSKFYPQLESHNGHTFFFKFVYYKNDPFDYTRSDIFIDII